MKAVFNSINFEESRSPEFIGVKWDGYDLLTEELVEKFADEVSGTPLEVGRFLGAGEEPFCSLIESLYEVYGDDYTISFPRSDDFITVIKSKQENATIWFKIVE